MKDCGSLQCNEVCEINSKKCSFYHTLNQNECPEYWNDDTEALNMQQEDLINEPQHGGDK